MRSTLRDVLLAHFPVPSSGLRRYVPVTLDTFEGQAWVTLLACEVEQLRRRLMPCVPGFDGYATLEVRTYVTVGGRPGFWLLSSDVTQPLAFASARLLRHVRSHLARVVSGREGQSFFFEARRELGGEAPARFSAHFAPMGPISTAERGSLVEFLVERYFLYSGGPGGLYRAEVNHRPWPLQPASGRLGLSGLLPDDVPLPTLAPLLHYCARLDVRRWPTTRTDVFVRAAAERPRSRLEL